MVQSNSLHYTSMLESAQHGNLRAISAWLNQALRPYGMRARVGSKRPGSLKLLVEFNFDFDPENPPNVWQDQLIRLICHRLWRLNSPCIHGVSIAACYLDQPQRLVWRQSVRIVTPASRTKQHHRQYNRQLRSRIRQTSRQKRRLRQTRALLVGGPAVAAVMVGGFLGYTRAPIEQTNANASAQPQDPPTNLPTRPDTVRTALETVSVVKHNEVANPQDPTVTLMFSGDVTLSDTFKEVMGHNYSLAFAKMPEYQQADVAMVNLENPLTRATLPIPGKQFNFKAEPEAIAALQSGGVDIVTLANNHSMDYDAAGLKETLSHLEAAGIEYMGAGEDLTQARRPQIIDVKGQRIAYLAYWGEEYGAQANQPGVNNIREERIAEDIRAIRDQVDWVVVNYHWGQELADFPADWQTKLAHFTVDQGADLVVGHHPHVLQGAEIYKGRPIAYSLGNFIFGGNSRTDYDTAVMRVALKDRQMKVEFLPVEVKGYQPQVAQGTKATDILNHITQLSTSFQKPMPTTVVLDAKTPALADPAAPPATDPTAPPPPAVTPPASELHPGAPIPAPLPAPDALSPAPPAGTKGTEPPATPDALTIPETDGATETPPPANPEKLDLLPGYGGNLVPTPVPAPTIDPLNPDAYLEAPPAAAPTPPSSNSISPDAPQPAASPQLPNFPPPGNSFTNSPDSTPLQFDQTPTENFERPPAGQIQGQVTAPQPAVSFTIPRDRADEEPLEVALAGPMMW